MEQYKHKKRNHYNALNAIILNLFKLEYLRQNLSVLIIIPAFLGGVWQLFELTSISISYIRFFSITQIVPDGLLIIYLLFVLVLLLLISSNQLFLKIFLRKHLNISGYKLTTFAISVINTLFFLLLIAPLKYALNWISTGDILWLLSIILILTLLYISIRNINPKSRFSNYLKNKFQFDLSILKHVFTYLFIFGFTISIALSIIKIHKTFTLPKSNLNIIKLEKNLKKELNCKRLSIRYFNDQYIFWNVSTSNNKTVIYITKLDELTK